MRWIVLIVAVFVFSASAEEDEEEERTFVPIGRDAPDKHFVRSRGSKMPVVEPPSDDYSDLLQPVTAPPRPEMASELKLVTLKPFVPVYSNPEEIKSNVDARPLKDGVDSSIPKHRDQDRIQATLAIPLIPAVPAVPYYVAQKAGYVFQHYPWNWLPKKYKLQPNKKYIYPTPFQDVNYLYPANLPYNDRYGVYLPRRYGNEYTYNHQMPKDTKKKGKDEDFETKADPLDDISLETLEKIDKAGKEQDRLDQEARGRGRSKGMGFVEEDTMDNLSKEEKIPAKGSHEHINMGEAGTIKTEDHRSKIKPKDHDTIDMSELDTIGPVPIGKDKTSEPSGWKPVEHPVTPEEIEHEEIEEFVKTTDKPAGNGRTKEPEPWEEFLKMKKMEEEATRKPSSRPAGKEPDFDSKELERLEAETANETKEKAIMNVKGNLELDGLVKLDRTTVRTNEVEETTKESSTSSSISKNSNNNVKVKEESGEDYLDELRKFEERGEEAP